MSSLTLTDEDLIADPELIEAVQLILSAFGIDPTAAPDERIAAAVAATTGLTFACLAAIRIDRKREWRDQIIASAMGALRHGAGN